MRFATIAEDRHLSLAIIRGPRVLPLAVGEGLPGTMSELAAGGDAGLRRVEDWVRRQPDRAFRALDDVELGPAVPDPGAIYTVGLNYGEPGEGSAARPDRPLIYAKLPTSVAGHGATMTWDRALTANVDPEVELGVVIGQRAVTVGPGAAMRHVFGYTCVNDISSRDPWLDSDQWLLGKSMAGFCPVGPCVVTPDEVSPAGLRLGCTINGVPIQDGRTDQMRFDVAEVISYLSHHTVLRPGDLIAMGTPARLAGSLGPERHLQAGDRVTVWIEQIGALTTSIA
jgi:2-keto-4-pentenoate hydratase/2-oxohepta-3-ene-1,7-dioic acid hydratase in catechol pathway